MRVGAPVAFGLALLAGLAAVRAEAGNWPSWRGPHQNGTADDTGLVSTWSTGGKNLIWRADFTGRSTPIVLRGQVCAIGRTGVDATKQEIIACYDAASGAKRWDYRQNVYHSTVAFNRIGWASMAGDPETGNVYAHGSGGHLNAFAPDGKKLWEIYLTEEFGRATGYGGRSQTPLVVGDRVILNFVTDGWGEQSAPRARVYAFDKLSGEVLWVTTPGKMPYDMNFQSNPVHAVIDGRSLVILGDADGYIYGLELATGKPIWSFALSRQGVQSTVVVEDDVVFASHGEENFDDPATMGRVVAFRAVGSGDLTSQELWRINELAAGFPSPAYSEGKLYVVDNSANLFRIDAGTGKVEWKYELGTVGKASPVVADGKIFVPETNGRFHILRPGVEAAESLGAVHVSMPDGRYAEIYGSPAIAYGRIYLSTEAGLYGIGDPAKPFRAEDTTPVFALPPGQGEPATLLVTPNELRIAPGQPAVFRASLYDAKGRPLGPAREVTWKLEGLKGEIDGGRFSPAGTAAQAGKITASAAGLTASARLRVVPPLPWSIDFEDQAVGSVPAGWVGATGKYEIQELDGQRVLAKPDRDRGLLRNPMFMGGDFSNYTIEADIRGGQIKRRMSDVGLLNSGYTLDLLGNHQRLEIRDWTAERRVAHYVDFAWQMDTWYRMKFDVRSTGGQGVIRGKVWKRGEAEPEAWTVEVEDPLPIKSGSPGLVGYSPADIYFDNIRVMESR